MNFRTTMIGLLLVVMAGTVIACSAPKKLDTTSGRPEINIQSLHYSTDDISSVLLNYYLDKGYSIARRDSSKIVINGPGKSGVLSASRLQLTFNFIETRENIRVVAKMKRQELNSLRTGKVENEVRLLPSNPTGKDVLEDLRKIKAKLTDDTAFKGIEEEPDSSKTEVEGASETTADTTSEKSDTTSDTE